MQKNSCVGIMLLYQQYGKMSCYHSMDLYSAITVLLLTLTHLFAEKLKFSYIPRSKWLSFAGGISVSYVFIHILPELAEGQEVVKEKALSFLNHHVYLIALFGLSLFYGLEKAAKQSYESEREEGNDEMPIKINIFWIHIFFFALYNAIIGYLIVQQETEGLSMMWFALAMAFHFIANDYALLDHYRKSYKEKGRWIITASIIIGWLVGVLAEVPEYGIAILFAFIAGGVILNVIKEELPKERKSNFWSFTIGLLLYTALLLLL